MQEAIYHATPLLAMPIFGDQDKNGEKIQNKGFGKYLLWESLTAESLEATIKELLTDPKYVYNFKIFFLNLA